MKFLLCLSLLFLISCASRESGWDRASESVSLSASEQKALKSESMKLWALRVDQESLKEALSKFELLHAANPEDLETLIYLTRGNYLLADSHLDDSEEKKRVFEKATSFGERAMATNTGFKESISEGKSVEESLNTLSIKEVPAMYWTAASLGKWAKASGIAAALKYKTRIKALIERVEKLDANYFYTAPARYWGGFYAVAPSFAGGDMNKSKENFEKSLKKSPEYLGTRVLMAELYWVKVGNKSKFQEELKMVLESKYDKHPQLGPENTLEKKKAEKLLKKMNELF